ncbi:MAG: hypothetical protein M5U01_08940 [Ardenticatenaceae bacterium]|nr:hypothetical protein [Ardenticatenaceae bacterium]
MNRVRSSRRLLVALSPVALALGLLVAQVAILGRPPALAAGLPGRTLLARLRPPHLPATAAWDGVLSRLPTFPTAPSPADEVQAAWRRAQQAGAYRFATEIVQTTYPAPRLTSVGRSSRVDTLYIEGETNLPEGTMQLVLWQDGGSRLNPRDGVEIRIEGDRAYGRTPPGRPVSGGVSATPANGGVSESEGWREVEDFSGAFAPGQDLLAYLAGARNVKREDVKREDGASGFTFDVDGPAFGASLRDQLERHLREQGELPAGLTLDISREYRDVVGQGEVWLDGDGLPLRLRVHLEYPQQANGERVEAEIKTDFAGFDRAAVVSEQSAGNSEQSPVNSEQWAVNSGRRALFTVHRSLFPDAGLWAALLGVVVLVVVHRGSRRVYAAVVVAVILSLGLSPALQGQQLYAFTLRQETRRAEQAQKEQESEAAREWQEGLLTSEWDPHQDPLGAVDGEQLAVNSEQGAGSSEQLPVNSEQSSVSSEQSLAISSLQSSISHLQSPAPDSDADGDGLTYLQESRLGTKPDNADSDDDGLRDDLEVKGFILGGKRWYSDPLSPDTNNDGLLDTMECWGTIPSSLPSNTACDLDSDKDGTPDLFDRDNDGDGVSDRVDLSPNKVLGSGSAPYTRDNPFKLVVNNLQKASGNQGYPVFVDFQLRPKNPDHLAYAMNVLDWPSGDTAGQIQRTKDTTFADTMTAAQKAANPSAANGDMRLVPMLEIGIPANNGAIPTLPLTDPKATRQIQGVISDTRWISATLEFTQQGSDPWLEFKLQDISGGVTARVSAGLCASKTKNLLYSQQNIANGNKWKLTSGQNLNSILNGANSIELASADGKKSVCANLGDIPNGPYKDKMIDVDRLATHAISVRDADDKGNMVAYVPMNLVKDETSGGKAAFSARMLYWPTPPSPSQGE